MGSFDLFGGIFDFDGDGKIDENDAFLGSLFSHEGNNGLVDDDPDEDDAEYDPFDMG